MASTIQYIAHHQIDKQRWNTLIQQAPNGLAYAHTDLLDALSPGWDALIMDDYRAAMPLTWRKKLGIRYLCQPAFCQQLGVFGRESVSGQVLEDFLKKAALSFRLIEIFLNYANKPGQPNGSNTNYLLSLNTGYAAIRQQYRKDLLKNLARCEKFNLQYRTSENIDTAIATYQSLYGAGMHYRKEDFEALAAVGKKWLPQGKCLVREVHLPASAGAAGSLLAIALFLKDENRIYNIASSTLPNGRTLEANHFLFDQLIREYAGKELILDFEGSDLPGVARFYQKFNPVNQPFFFWKSNRLPAVLRWWKR